MLETPLKKSASSFISNNFLNILLGPTIFMIMLAFPLADIPFNARGGLGLLIWMLLWWIMRPVHPSVTALLPIVVTAMLGFVPIELILSKYASPVVFLLIGANILTLTWQRWGLDKRIALFVLSKVGTSVRRQIIVWFCLAAGFSSIIPNAVVAAVLFPIALGTLAAANIKTADDYNASEYATGVILAIAWGSSIGVATPLGGAANLAVIQFIEDMILNDELMFIDWVIKIFPLFLTVSIPLLIVILRFPFEYSQLPNGPLYFIKEYLKLGKWHKGEWWGLILFITAVALTFLRPLFADFLPGLQPAYIFLTAALLTFLIKVDGEDKLVTWEYVQPKLMWGVYILFAGGMALGEVIAKSGAAEMIIKAIIPLTNFGLFVTILVFALLAGVLSNIMTITGSMAITVPLAISTLSQIGVNPLPIIFIICAAGNVAIMLPSSSGGPALAAAYGVDLAKMARRGAIAALISITLAIIVGYLLLLYWPKFT